MAYFRTEIEPIYLKPMEGYNDIEGIQVTTKGSDFIQKTVSTEVGIPDTDRTYRKKFRAEDEVEYNFVSQFPSIESFKKTIERERVILFSRKIVSYGTGIGSYLSSVVLNEPNWGILLIATSWYFSGRGNIPFLGSRLGRPGMSKEVIDSEAKAFKETYPDQKLREYNPLNLARGLGRLLRHNH